MEQGRMEWFLPRGCVARRLSDNLFDYLLASNFLVPIAGSASLNADRLNA